MGAGSGVLVGVTVGSGVLVCVAVGNGVLVGVAVGSGVLVGVGVGGGANEQLAQVVPQRPSSGGIPLPRVIAYSLNTQKILSLVGSSAVPL